MPTKRFSTRSRRPTPLSWPSWFSLVSIAAGDHGHAVDGHGVAALEVHGEDGGLIRRILRRDGALVDEFGGLDGRVLQHLPSEDECNRLASTLNGASPRLSLAIGIWCFSAKSISASRLRELPFAPGGDDGDVGLERVIGHLEADLVVPLPVAPWQTASAPTLRAMSIWVLAISGRAIGGAEQVLALIDRVGPEHREDVVADELLAQVLDEDVLGLDAHAAAPSCAPAPAPRPGPGRR